MVPMRSRSFTLAALAAALAVSSGVALGAGAWRPVDRAHLEVTEGTVVRAGPHARLRTASAAMRATARDGGRHPTRARLRFTLVGDSDTTAPLGSGLVRRQIGLKLLAHDPCNLVYVMWRAYPDHAVAVYVKRNPGQTTSSECGNRGYTDVATIDLAGAADERAHVLEARIRRMTDGSAALAVYTDGALLTELTLPSDLAAGLDGPIGVRSDNGDYLFRLSAPARSS
jgi:hypothetical protein